MKHLYYFLKGKGYTVCMAQCGVSAIEEGIKKGIYDGQMDLLEEYVDALLNKMRIAVATGAYPSRASESGQRLKRAADKLYGHGPRAEKLVALVQRKLEFMSWAKFAIEKLQKGETVQIISSWAFYEAQS